MIQSINVTSATDARRLTRRRPSRGFALVLTLAAIALLALATLTVSSTASSALEAILIRLQARRATHAAEAGLADAVLALRANDAWSGFTPSLRTLPTFPDLTYTLEVTNNSAGSAGVTAPDGTAVPAGAVYLRATGTAARGVQRIATALATRQGSSLFRYAVFGTNGVTSSGSSLIDAFDATLGPYSTAAVIPGAADVGTNATTAGAIALKGGTVVNGDLTVGPGADPATAIVGAASALGSVYVAGSPFALPAVAPSPMPSPPYSNVVPSSGSSFTLAPGAYGDLSVNGGTVLLQTGTYVFGASTGSTGSVTLKSGATLAVAPGAGPVRVYFAGSWNSSGGAVVNPTGLASNLVIAGLPTVTSVTLAGNAGATYAAYVPTADIKVTGGTYIEGALIGASVKLSSGVAVHYDRSLTRAPDFSSQTGWALTALHRQ